MRTAAFAAVALGGALGSTARYAVALWFGERVGTAFPWGTFAINLAGSFCIGIVLQIAGSRTPADSYLRTFVATGFLGGFTTFSAFSFEAYALVARGALGAAMVYAAGSVLLGVAAAAAGALVARAV